MHHADFMSGIYKMGIAVTGGGTGIIPTLLEHGGMSSVLEDAYVPYSVDALCSFLGVNRIEKACSPLIANFMAHTQHDKLTFNRFYKPSPYFLGVGATFSLRKKGHERAGRKHEGFVGLVQTGYDELGEFKGCKEEVWHINFDTKFDRSRVSEETFCTMIMFDLIREFIGSKVYDPIKPVGVEIKKVS